LRVQAGVREKDLGTGGEKDEAFLKISP